jgi:hypothetical protein
VRLAPDRDYAVSFNHACCEGFRNTRDEPAIPWPLTFSTAPDPDARPRTTANRRALRTLRGLLDTDDAHRDLAAVDWDARFEAFAPRLLAAPSARSFARIAADLLAPVPDAHRWVSVGSMDYRPAPASDRSAPAPNVDPSRLPALVAGWTDAGIVSSGMLGDIGYLRVTEWEAGATAAVATLRSLERAHPSGLIVDVRENPGGDETIAESLAGCFVVTPTPYAIARVREHGAWIGPFERVLAPTRGCAFPADRVVVLAGPVAASSNESFLLMMRAAGATLLGETSAGSSGRPVRHRLENGVVAWLPSWIDAAPDGTPIEGRGVAPDVPVVFDRADPGDTVLAAAVARLAPDR